MAKIILLHGLHMHSWVMKPLAYLLEQEGFEVALFDYYSVLHSMNRHVEDLARWIDENHADETLHFVGHSLGGLVLRNFAAAYPDKVSGRIVTMGTPHQGSRAAQRVFNMGLQKPVLGGSYKGALDGSMPELPEGVELGSIAGNKPYGLGRVLGCMVNMMVRFWSEKRIVRICAIMLFCLSAIAVCCLTVKRSSKW